MACQAVGGAVSLADR